ncbi:hypothetical protein Tco_0178496 [Tanacetum coccineum]
MCRRLFHEESEEVEKYIGGLPDMIRGNGHFKKDCPKLKNGNCGNQRGNGNAPAKVSRKTTPLVYSCQRDPEARALSLINQDLLYLKKGNSRPEKIELSLHKFPNPHAKIFYIRKQKEPGKPKEESYSNSKIVQVIKTYWELGHEHKFITEIVARRANDCIVPDYADTGLLWSLSKVNLTTPTMTFPRIEDHEMFSIIYEHVHGIIYKNNKKEKRVMRHSEIHKFFDATLNRVLEGLKSYNNDVKVRNHTEAYQIFVEMLKKFVRDDLVKLWHLVKERFSTTEPTDDKEKELWVELKRLFEPDNDDILWKLQRYMHDPLVWRLYDTCGVHHVSSVRGHDIFMLVEKDYPLSKGVLMLMLVNKLLVEADSEMSRELLRKIFIQANRSRQGGLLGIRGFYNLMLLVQVCAAAED